MSFVTSSLWNRLFCAFFLTSIIALQSLFAQGSGSIKGRVVDNESGDPLIGANVVIQNTSLGTSADVEGKFYLPIVPAGKWTMKVTYIGYTLVTREVTVAENVQLVLDDFRLSPQAIMGQTVLVTAQARGQIGAINQQLASNAIVSVVSEDKIKELPDFNAAEAIGRLPGVSTLRSSGEASKVVVRGIAPQYNLVAVDGVNLAATGNGGGIQLSPQFPSQPIQDRSVDVTMITPNMLQSIEVYKTLTPDMDADAIGGYVNMKLREAPSGLHTDLNWQSGYVKKNSKYNNYKANAVVSDRFFDDALGVYLLGNAEQYDRGADNFNASYAKVSGGNLQVYNPVVVTSIGLDRHFETRSRYGANLILDYRLPDGSIKAVNMFSRLTSDFTDYTTNQNLVPGGTKDLNFNLSYGKGTNDLMTNALQGEYDLRIMSVNLSAANSYSRNFTPHQYTYTFAQRSAYAGQQIPADTPPEKLITNTKYDSSQTDLQYLGDGSYNFKENGQTYAANFKIPFNFKSSASGFLKLGVKYRYTHRVNDQELPYAQIIYGGSRFMMDSVHNNFPSLPQDFRNPNQPAFLNWGFSNPDQSIARDFLDNKFGDLKWVPTSATLDAVLHYIENTPALRTPQNNGWISGPYQNLINDYTYVERYYASYGMAELDVGPNLMIVGGVRFEEDRSDFTAYRIQDSGNQLTNPYEKVTVRPENHYWLPMVQAKYNVLEWADVRYSYTKTLSRPDFTGTSPYQNANNQGSYINAGNPGLVPAESYNNDLMLTFHNNDIGLFSLGGFYKTMYNFIYQTQYVLAADSLTPPGFYKHISDFSDVFAKAGANVTTWVNNPYKATLKGVEVDWQTRFWYLPFPFDGIVLGINYTYISSDTKYPYVYSVLATWVPGRNKPSVPVDTSRAGPLIFQPSDIVNVSLGYDYKDFSGRISFLYQGKRVSWIANIPEGDGYTQPYLRIDALIKQKLPWYGVQLFLDVNNINERSDISAQQTFGGFTSEQFYGLTADVGIRVTL